MLNERASSSTSLRFQNQRRHKIRNLRAKVRSLLPEHVCPREIKRSLKSGHFHSAHHSPSHITKHSSTQISKKLHRQFDKLSPEELEEINTNKPYYLGTEASIAQYEQYIKLNHPELINKKFAPPTLEKKDITTLAFVPFSLLSRELFISTKSLLSQKQISDKRGSTATSLYRKRDREVKTPQNKRSLFQSRVKAESCQYRKNQQDQELRVRREMNWANLQRQQKVASVMKQNYIQEKAEQAKLLGDPSTYNRGKPQTNKYLIEKYEVGLLTSKLRKVCLKKSQRPESVM